MHNYTLRVDDAGNLVDITADLESEGYCEPCDACGELEANDGIEETPVTSQVRMQAQTSIGLDTVVSLEYIIAVQHDISEHKGEYLSFFDEAKEFRNLWATLTDL